VGSVLRSFIQVLDPAHRSLRTLLERLMTGDPEEDFAPRQLSQALHGWQDVKTSLATASRLGFSDPSWAKFTDNGQGSTGIYLPHFSAAQNNEVFFDIQLPHGHRGTAKVHVHWAPVTTHVGNVVWEFEYAKSSRLASIGNSSVNTITVATRGTAKREQITPLLTIDNLEDSDILICRLARLGGDVADTFTGLAAGMSIDAHVSMKHFGSDIEYPGAEE
jgi:hypothetical protein